MESIRSAPCAEHELHATRDAELRHTQIGKSVSNIRLAANRMDKGEMETQVHTMVARPTTVPFSSTTWVST